MAKSNRIQFSNDGDSASHMTFREKIAARNKAMEGILDLLSKEGKKPVSFISQKLGLKQSTAHKYLLDMMRNQRNIRRSGELDDHKRVLWEIGEDPALPSPEDFLEMQFAPNQKYCIAVQVGIKRDPLVAALFGPAKESVEAPQ